MPNKYTEALEAAARRRAAVSGLDYFKTVPEQYRLSEEDFKPGTTGSIPPMAPRTYTTTEGVEHTVLAPISAGDTPDLRRNIAFRDDPATFWESRSLPESFGWSVWPHRKDEEGSLVPFTDEEKYEKDAADAAAKEEGKYVEDKSISYSPRGDVYRQMPTPLPVGSGWEVPGRTETFISPDLKLWERKQFAEDIMMYSPESLEADQSGNTFDFGGSLIDLPEPPSWESAESALAETVPEAIDLREGSAVPKGKHGFNPLIPEERISWANRKRFWK